MHDGRDRQEGQRNGPRADRSQRGRRQEHRDGAQRAPEEARRGRIRNVRRPAGREDPAGEGDRGLYLERSQAAGRRHLLRRQLLQRIRRGHRHEFGQSWQGACGRSRQPGSLSCDDGPGLRRAPAAGGAGEERAGRPGCDHRTRRKVRLFLQPHLSDRGQGRMLGGDADPRKAPGRQTRPGRRSVLHAQPLHDPCAGALR